MRFLMQVGSFLEIRMGSSAFLLLNIILILLVGPVQMLMALLLQGIGLAVASAWLVSYASFWNGVGFSAVLFGYEVILVHFMESRAMVNWYCWRVQLWVTPFLSLIFLTVIFRASFMGHLSGILVGYMLMCDKLRWLHRPATRLDAALSNGCLSGLYRHPKFQLCPEFAWDLDRPVDVLRTAARWLFRFTNCCSCCWRRREGREHASGAGRILGDAAPPASSSSPPAVDERPLTQNARQDIEMGGSGSSSRECKGSIPFSGRGIRLGWGETELALSSASTSSSPGPSAPPLPPTSTPGSLQSQSNSMTNEPETNGLGDRNEGGGSPTLFGPDVDRPTVGLPAVGQTGVSVVGEITAKFSHPSLPKKVFPHRLTVTEDSGYEAVLGQDFLKLLDPVVQYHYREDRLDVADLPSFEVWYEDGRKPMHVSAFTRTKVPKRARALVRVQVEGMEGEETVILRRNYPRGFPGLAIPDQVVDVKAGVATVEVINIATNLIRLGPNSLLTFAEPFSRVSSVTAVTANAPASAYTQQPPIPKKEDSPVPALPSQKLPPVDFSHLSRELRERYERVLQEYSDLWSRSRFDIGELRVDGKPFEVTIPTGDSPPIRWNQDRIPYHQREHVKKELQKMEEGGVIRPSTSPWAAPVVLIKKPDGTTRFCLDFCKLNQATKRDLFPLPQIQETLDRLTGAKVFSALDYTSGFQQLHMHPDHAEKTAFVTPFGLYEFTKMPFGLVNAPSVFQRAMNLVLAGLSRDLALVYIDDIIVFSQSHDEHIQDLREVLGLVRKANLKLKLEKAQIAMTEVEYLGYTVSEKRVRPSRKNIQKILQWEPP
uniref:Reverse transcriptase domain-containing protein n=1 Tax=Chromera velia CCMP2878 TaxID=1169474 RepID=A0A0G4F828_9ALVE|eukprot:Cvel_15722.t1-p1 / transcript=Cvel_15722.t1 / gene=Cvel_15722 / organism=Chromera_velia_CCMP2878 / gene_product=Retrovirus-related Pol polyprotein from transposon, putative / transcript_product=Retrovirus-related Pol polyprotein from transposon, putative / location=Cvel_scaffold1175:38121-48239(+) / protein_length=826 / sequence_SO=supercontig / SO=protein_coding / is_pseudo=false